jgi:hypothetical protein
MAYALPIGPLAGVCKPTNGARENACLLQLVVAFLIIAQFAPPPDDQSQIGESGITHHP